MPNLKAAGLCGLPPFPFFKPAILLPFQVLSTTEITQTVEDAETGEIIETNVETFQTVETIETVVTVETVGTMDAQGQDPSIPRRARSTAQRQCKSPLEVIGNSGGGPYAQTCKARSFRSSLSSALASRSVDLPCEIFENGN